MVDRHGWRSHREQDTIDAQGVVWHNDGVHQVDDQGAAELYPVDTDDADAGEIDALARTATYMCQFINHDSHDGGTASPTE